MLTRLRPEPVLVLAFRGLLNRTYSVRARHYDHDFLNPFHFRSCQSMGAAFKINQNHLATIATLAKFSVDKLT